MQELPELCICREATQTRGEDLAGVGVNAWKVHVSNVGVPVALHGSVYVTGTPEKAARRGPSRISGKNNK